MTDQRSPLESALDLLVYAPVGLALTAAEELPKLAAKGRAQVQGQMTIARMVGQFAVAQGRKEIEKRLGGAAPPTAAPNRTSPSQPAAAPPSAAHDTATGGSGSYERLSGHPEAPEAAGEPDAEPSPAEGAKASGAAGNGSVIDVDFGRSSRSALPAEGLAIPGYDSLSASQVVQRLAGLSQDELAAVGEYEAAHRGRRTILTRVGQLKG
ncbi:MAG TPA: hypothetical protein VNF71_09945 [Acidimicrobiales bacterium]|nr:hypothetical protein [Acidimicrobiales bacterium]